MRKSNQPADLRVLMRFARVLGRHFAVNQGVGGISQRPLRSWGQHRCRRAGHSGQVSVARGAPLRVRGRGWLSGAWVLPGRSRRPQVLAVARLGTACGEPFLCSQTSWLPKWFPLDHPSKPPTMLSPCTLLRNSRGHFLSQAGCIKGRIVLPLVFT